MKTRLKIQNLKQKRDLESLKEAKKSNPEGTLFFEIVKFGSKSYKQLLLFEKDK